MKKRFSYFDKFFCVVSKIIAAHIFLGVAFVALMIFSILGLRDCGPFIGGIYNYHGDLPKNTLIGEWVLSAPRQGDAINSFSLNEISDSNILDTIKNNSLVAVFDIVSDVNTNKLYLCDNDRINVDYDTRYTTRWVLKDSDNNDIFFVGKDGGKYFLWYSEYIRYKQYPINFWYKK